MIIDFAPLHPTWAPECFPRYLQFSFLFQNYLGNSVSVCSAAVISLRTVPDQDSAVLEQLIHDHLVSAMAARGTRNTLRMRVTARGKWWLQDPFSDSYQAAARAIEKHWGVKPIFVCEGGTLRVTPFLEEVRAVVLLLCFVYACVCLL